MKIATSRSGLDLSDLFLKKGSVNWEIFKPDSSSSSNLLPEKNLSEKNWSFPKVRKFKLSGR